MDPFVVAGLSFADSSVEGTTSWKSRGNRMVIQADQGQNEGGYAVELHVTINGTVFDGRCTIANPDVRRHFFRLRRRLLLNSPWLYHPSPTQESLALLYPLEGPTRRRAAYTHKV